MHFIDVDSSPIITTRTKTSFLLCSSKGSLAAGGQTSQAAMVAAAAAAMAAASQWSNAANPTANGHNSAPGLPPPPQLTPAPAVSVGQHASATLAGAAASGSCTGVLDAAQSPQVAALAAAVAAQQQLAAAAAAAWRWSSPSAAVAAAAASQQNGGGALLAPSPSTLTPNGAAATPTGQSVSQTASQQVSGALYESLFSRFLYHQQQPALGLNECAAIITSGTSSVATSVAGDINTEEMRSAKRPRLKVDD